MNQHLKTTDLHFIDLGGYDGGQGIDGIGFVKTELIEILGNTQKFTGNFNDMLLLKILVLVVDVIVQQIGRRNARELGGIESSAGRRNIQPSGFSNDGRVCSCHRRHRRPFR